MEAERALSLPTRSLLAEKEVLKAERDRPARRVWEEAKQ